MGRFMTEDHIYRRVGSLDLTATLYRPDVQGPIPYVIDIHGGAWRDGDRFNNTATHENFASNGIGVFAADFRSSEQARFPEPVQDVNYAIRWFKSNMSRLDIEASTIGGLGTSSGGHQLGLVALRPEYPLYALADPSLEDVDASIAFFIACWPILDPQARLQYAIDDGIERLVENTQLYFPDESAMAVGNPQHIVDDGGYTRLPPMIIIQGTRDDNIPHGRADIFAASYIKAGGEIKVHKFDGEQHAFVSREPTSKAAQEAIDIMRNFIMAQSR
jgi:acetyl esterase